MSGGSFDYAYSSAENFADALEIKLDRAGTCLHDEAWPIPEFEPPTMAKLREIVDITRHAAKLMREAEWLYSGDTGDDSFMERVREIESSNALGEGRERGILREASSGEAATSTDGLEGGR